MVVASCGTLPSTPAVGTASGPIAIDQTGKLCVNATVSASVTGFTPNNNYASLTATNASASVALPAGAVVFFQNTGTTTVSCTLGVGSATATANEIQVPASSGVPLVVGSNTFGACIDQTGSASNVVVLAGGAGLANAFGGGNSSGGGGGAVTVANGADVVEGNNTDAASCASATSVVSCLRQLHADVIGTGSVQGGAANGVATAGNPLQMGCVAQSAEAPVLAGQAASAVCDLARKLILLPYANPELFVSGVTAAMTGTTSTSILAAPAASVRNYLTQLICTNSHATVGTFVLVQDGSGGTTIYEGYAAAVGGGFSITFPVALRQPTTATALFVQDVTTGANVICSASGYKGA